MSAAEQRLAAAIAEIERYVAIERQFAEGAADERVVTPNGDYPTLAGIAARGEQSAVLLQSANDTLAAAQDLRDAAAASAQAAAQALADARAARDAAQADSGTVAASVGLIEYHHGRVLLLAGERY